MTLNDRRPTAFVIMPFSREFDRIYADLIVPALSDYDVVRADSHLNQQNILRSIVEGIYSADLIIADVTDTNANVMYELGAAHALGKPTVMISQSIGDLPFDLRSYLVQAYATHGEDAVAFMARLREIGAKHAMGQLRFGNPIVDFLPMTLATKEALLPAAAEPLSDIDYGYLDYAADMDQYGTQVWDEFGKMNGLTSKLAEDIRALAPALHRVRSSGAVREERMLLVKLATLMDGYSEQVKSSILPKFHEGWERVGHAMNWMASQRPANLDPSKVAELCATGRSLRQSLNTIVTNVSSVREVIVTGRGKTGALDKAIRFMEHVFNSIVSEAMIADAAVAAVFARLGCSDATSG